MRITFENFRPLTLAEQDAIHAAIAAQGIEGFTGITCDGNLNVEFPDRESLTAEEHNAVDVVVATCEPPAQ